MVVNGHTDVPAALVHRKEHQCYRTGGWMCHRHGLNEMWKRKYATPMENRPRTVSIKFHKNLFSGHKACISVITLR
jgi:hypothetical protein